MSDLVPITVFLSFIILLIGILTSEYWWGFWRPDQRAIRKHNKLVARRIANLIALGATPYDAKMIVAEQVHRESKEAIALYKELM